MGLFKNIINFSVYLFTYYPCLHSFRTNLRNQMTIISNYKKSMLETIDLEMEAKRITNKEIIDICNKLIELTAIKCTIYKILKDKLKYKLDVEYNQRALDLVSSNYLDRIVDDQIKIAIYIANVLQKVHARKIKVE